MEGQTVRVSVTIPKEVKSRVAALAAKQKRSFSNTLALLLEAQLDKLDIPDLPAGDK